MVRVAFACVCLAALAACSGNGGGGGGEQNQQAASGNAHFVNSPDNARSMALRDAYVDFSFDYPARWSITPQPIDGTAQNYVRVAAPMVNGYEPYAFLVGHVSGTGNAARDAASLPAATRALAEQFGASLQNYQIVSTGAGRIAGYASYGWRFSATGPSADGGPPVQIFGRGELILPPGAARGVTLVALATSRAGDVHSAAEVGASGPLKAILDSFHLVASTAAPSPAASPALPTPEARSALENETSRTPPNAAEPQAHPRPSPPVAPTPTRPAPAATPRPATPAPTPRPAAPAPQPAAPAAAPERPRQEQPSPPPPPSPPHQPPAGNGQ